MGHKYPFQSENVDLCIAHNMYGICNDGFAYGRTEKIGLDKTWNYFMIVKDEFLVDQIGLCVLERVDNDNENFHW